MALEIERKFLVTGDYKSLATSHSRIVQGYICSERGRTVRVRLRDERGYLTIKGPSNNGGLSRYEFEHEISKDEALSLFRLCEPGIVDKIRWLVPAGRHTFEVDEFFGENEGLVVAEVELGSEDEAYGHTANGKRSKIHRPRNKGNVTSNQANEPRNEQGYLSEERESSSLVNADRSNNRWQAVATASRRCQVPKKPTPLYNRSTKKGKMCRNKPIFHANTWPS